jgi:hypothetical protein
MISFLFHVLPNQGIFLENKNKISIFGWAVNEKCDIFFHVFKRQSGKLIRQPVDFPQREKSPYSSARSPSLPVKLAFHACSPPDGFLTSLPDFQIIC